ncbi:hypothetical protein WJX72_009123 [[Myrmecia] bisecta]|uniref:F-box domain-containing protein n=1 Tax=[Myrmecia] bisecta TaxID=41462 RepID=A0AAW1R9F8_9CHLO
MDCHSQAVVDRRQATKKKKQRMHTKSQTSISSLPDHIMSLILSKTGEKARVCDVPLVCLTWRRLAEQLTAWENIEVNCLHLDGRLAANPVPGYLLWLRKHAAGIKAIAFRLPTPDLEYDVWHESLQMLYQQVLTASLCLLSQPWPSTLSQLRSISYSSDFEEGNLACLMDHLVLFRELLSLRIDCVDTAENLFVDWHTLADLRKLENLRVEILGRGSEERLPPECYNEMKISKNFGHLQQLPSLRKAVFEDVGELEEVSQDRSAALQARFVQQDRGGVVELR